MTTHSHTYCTLNGQTYSMCTPDHPPHMCFLIQTLSTVHISVCCYSSNMMIPMFTKWTASWKHGVLRLDWKNSSVPHKALTSTSLNSFGINSNWNPVNISTSAPKCTNAPVVNKRNSHAPASSGKPNRRVELILTAKRKKCGTSVLVQQAPMGVMVGVHIPLGCTLYAPWNFSSYYSASCTC